MSAHHLIEAPQRWRITVRVGDAVHDTTLGEFVADNIDCLPPQVVADIVDALHHHRPVQVGGGAAPLVTLTRMED